MASETYNMRGLLEVTGEDCTKEKVLSLKEQMESYGIEVETTENECTLKIEVLDTFRSILDDIEEFVTDLNLKGKFEGEEMDYEYEHDWEEVSYTFGE